MKVTYAWIILYSCLFFGSGILCHTEFIEEFEYADIQEFIFYCSDGGRIEVWLTCDGKKDCSDGSDESKEMCLYKNGSNITMNCGRVNVKNQITFEDSTNKAAKAEPWTVDIYKLNETDSKHYFKCAGSIIAPNLVISANRCVGDSSYSGISGSHDHYMIVVGNYDSHFTVDDNGFTQIINAQYIYLPEKNEYGTYEYGLYENGIALIILVNKISFTNGVAPVCVDWLRNENREKITVLVEMRNGTQSPISVRRLVPYINSSICQKKYSHIKYDNISVPEKTFCAGAGLDKTNLDSERSNTRPVYSTLQGVGLGDYGTGISFLHNNSFFLTGVLTKWEKMEESIVLGFTDLSYFYTSIQMWLNRYVTVGNSCILPAVKGVVYSYEGSNEILSHGTLINRDLNVIENCEVGYHKAYPYSLKVCQGNNKWLSNDTFCFKMCQPLESDSLDFKYRYNGKYANGSNLLMPDTIATPSCKPTYTDPNERPETPFELLCQSDGTWDKQLYKCNKHCGRAYNINQAILYDPSFKNVELWNVGIYKFNKKKYDLICGGSIISPNLVVSAAHCFWENGMISNISVNDGLYKISVGKFARNFTVTDNDFNKIFNIKMIHLNENYHGFTGFYLADIAIIVLQNRVNFNTYVAPVCIDWDGKYNVVNGDRGKVVGWGKSFDITSTFLLEETISYIDHETCQKMYTNGSKEFVTRDKFCAGAVELHDTYLESKPISRQVIAGNSGAGLTFSHSDLYYLTGVLSVKNGTTDNSVALYTDIKYHLQWIRGLYNKYIAQVTINACVLPTIKGVVYSYEGSNEILSHGSLINLHLTVIEDCEVGYDKAFPYGFRVCQENGKWKTVSDKLCFKKCSPLKSDSLDIKCTLNGKYANCSTLSMPDTIATASCKPTYKAPNGQVKFPLELHCQYNGTWDKQLYRCNPSNACILPTVEGVLYSFEGSKEVLSHGSLINHHTTIIENCEIGYHKDYPNGFRFCEGNGKWITVYDKLCFKMCPPLESDSLDINCSYNGKYANCSKVSIPNTIATPSCKLTYTAPNGLDETPLELLCQPNGTWNKQLFRCNPYCGRLYVKNQILISNGEKARAGTAPWNVGIYRLNKINSNYDLICGGSIISPNLIVSAAHCFWQKGMISYRISVNDGLYTVAVGKYAKDFTVIDNEFTKIFNVETIYLKEHYYGPTGFHAEDIAIIVLQNRISFSNGVAPVCIDWNSNYNVVNGDQGKVVGWGKTENSTSSPVLLEASLPYIDHRICRDLYRNGFEPFVTVDKFCAGSPLILGQGVGEGDSGSGLCFLHSNSYYLTGVVSLKDPNTNNSIAVFTDIKHHIQWIRGLYNRYN